MPIARFIGNFIWFLFSCFMALAWLLAGVLVCCTIVGIPFGLQAFKIARMSLFPFGYEVVATHRTFGCLGLGMNILWLCIVGFWLAIGHLFTALFLCIPIITIPFALQHVKLAKLALLPFGMEIRKISDINKTPMDL